MEMSTAQHRDRGREPSAKSYRHSLARFLARPEHVAQRRDIKDIGIVRMNADPADMAGLFQSQMSPASTGIGRPVYTIAVRYVASDRRLTHGGIDDVGVGPGDRERADAGARDEIVGNAARIDPAIDRLPYPPAQAPK